MRLNKNSDLLLQLISDILDFSKIEAGTFDIHLKKFDFKEICEEIYAVHTLKIPDHVRFSFNRDLPSVKLNSDPKRLTQVISNFLTNAIKFTSNGEIKLDYRLKENICIRNRYRHRNQRRSMQKHIRPFCQTECPQARNGSRAIHQ